jgi:tetratricopeptide (TPR) repeat protein
MTEIKDPKNLYDISQLLTDRGDFVKALTLLIEAKNISLAQKNFDLYLKCVQNILRIYSEREDYDQLAALKESLHDTVIREGIQLNSRVYYVFGIAATYKGQIDTALEYFKIALDHALQADNKEDICYAILGLSICYKNQKRYDEALKEIYNLNIFLQFIENPDLIFAVSNSNALIHFDLKRYDSALSLFWIAYENAKKTKSFAAMQTTLINIGACLFESGQRDTARVYLDLAARSIDTTNSQRALRTLNQYLAHYKQTAGDDFDLDLDFDNHLVVEKQLGKIDFKNQFILLDLLKLFLTRQGEVFSKEYLVENIWKQNYDPEVHDNKIYVTIKRLRKMIEPDYDHPKYIFRSKNGYYLNKSIKTNQALNSEGRI